MTSYRVKVLAAAATLALSPLLTVHSQAWEQPNGDKAGRKFSELTQITRDNVSQLKLAWQYRTGDAKNRPELLKHSATQATPIMLPEESGGHLVTCSNFNDVIALDPITGKERWRYDAKINLKSRWAFKCRGVSFWRDSERSADQACASRLYMAALDRRLISLDAITGEPCEDFGENGIVKLYDESKGKPEFTFSVSPAVIVNGIVVVASAVNDFSGANTDLGTVEALDARTGEQRWRFTPIPTDPKSPVADNWPANPQTVSGAANAWAPLSVDEELDMVYVPVGAASPDYYGAYRPGDNRYANSLVALKGSTGEVVWHFQTTHHDIWDYDLPTQPLLVDIKQKEKSVPAVVQLTKQGMVFIFNRETGEPLFEIEERAVPQSGHLPGDQLSPTQPFPVKPAPLVSHRISPDDAWGLTFWDKAECREKIESSRNEGIYTPLGLEPTILQPAALGGVNWGGGAVWPDKNLLVVNVNTTAMIAQMLPIDEALKAAKERTMEGQRIIAPMGGTPYGLDMGPFVSSWGIPCTPPPWGKLVAVDLANGEIRWQSTLGSVHELGPVTVPFEIEWGTPNFGGPLVTASGLVFIAATMDRRIRAFDAQTGEKLWTFKLPVDATATPMTYEKDGRQYVVIVAGGHHFFERPLGDYVLAFALPDE